MRRAAGNVLGVHPLRRCLAGPVIQRLKRGYAKSRESYGVALTSRLRQNLQQESEVVRHKASLTGEGREPQPDGQMARAGKGNCRAFKVVSKGQQSNVTVGTKERSGSKPTGREHEPLQ